MPANYTYYDALGIERTIPSVLEPVALASVVTNVTSGTENQVTVATTAGLFPGMPVSIPNIPPGSFIHSIRSGTVIDLYRSAWNATTGVFSTSAANANATAAASGLTGHASGFDPLCLVSQFYATGTWRNIIRAPGWLAVSYNEALGTGQLPWTTDPTYAGTGISSVTTRSSDELAATPLRRHNGEPWAFYILVSSGGFQSLIQAIPGREPLYAGPTT